MESYCSMNFRLKHLTMMTTIASLVNLMTIHHLLFQPVEPVPRSARQI